MTTQKTYSPEEAQKRFETLPPEIKRYLYSAEMMTALRQIADKYKLHIDKLGMLEAETSSVMLGFTETSDFPSMLMEALQVDEMNANLIAKEVNDQIFLKIRDAMKNAPEKSVVMPSKAAPTPPPSAPAVPPRSV